MDQLVNMFSQARGQIVSDPNEADAFAWAAESPGAKLKQIGFKHPPLGDTHVRIKITYTGVCQSDVSIIHKKYGDIFPTVWPTVCGHEIIGKINKLGKEVTEFKEGDLVGVGPIRDCCSKCSYCLRGQTNLCSSPTWKFTAGCYFGGFATEIQLPSSYVIKIPDGMDEKLTPSLMCAGGTVFNPIRRFGKPGCKVGVIGIGGLGHLAIMFANKLGYTVYAISTSDSKRNMAIELGAHEYVVSKNEEDMKKFATAEIDLMINTTSTPDIMPYFHGLKKGSGVFIQVGGPEGNNLNLSVADFILNQYTFGGSAAFSIEDAKEMLELCSKHKIYPKCEFFSWENFNDAVDKCANGKVEFRSVVDVGTFQKP